MEEYQIWTLFQNARIANGLTLIATVLIIWLSLELLCRRTPVSGEEPNIVTKTLSSAFCLLNVIFHLWNVDSDEQCATVDRAGFQPASGKRHRDFGYGWGFITPEVN